MKPVPDSCPACVTAGPPRAVNESIDWAKHNIACAKTGERVYRWPPVLSRRAA